jgi:hypothetical protein
VDGDLEQMVIITASVDEAFEISEKVLILFLAATQVLTGWMLWNSQLIIIWLSRTLASICS